MTNNANNANASFANLGFALIGGACMAVVLNCGTPALTPANIARANARAAVEVAKDAWVLTANACSALADADPAAAKCAKPLVISHDLIVEAAQAVDTDWSPKAACALAQAGTLLAQGSAVLGLDGAAAKAVSSDAAVLSAAVLGSASCTPAPDAGAPEASPPPSAPVAAPAQKGTDI